MANDFPVLGFDIGGTKIAVCLGTDKGELLRSKRLETRNREPDDVLKEMLETGNELLREEGLTQSDLRAIGVGSPAPMDIPKGLILAPTNLKKWKNVPIRDFLADNFGVETFFDNDANAGALAEWFFGSGKESSDMIYLTMSTGIGGGIVANGHLLHGKSFIAGEVGHVVLDMNGPVCNCGLTGCYEAYCGGLAIAQRMRRELADHPEHPIVKFAGGDLMEVDVKGLVEAVKMGDGYANRVWDEMCLRHAQAIGIFLNTFSPGIIVLGTIATATGSLFLDPVKRYLPRFSWKQPREACELKTSALGAKTGEYAGICVALNGLYEKGEWGLPWE